MRPSLRALFPAMALVLPLLGGIESMLYQAQDPLAIGGGAASVLLRPAATGAFPCFPSMAAPQGWGSVSYDQLFRGNLAPQALPGLEGNGALTAEVPLDHDAWGLGFHWQYHTYSGDAFDQIAMNTGTFQAFDSLALFTLRRSFWFGEAAKNVELRGNAHALSAGLSIKVLSTDWGQKIGGVSSGDTRALAALVDAGLSWQWGRRLSAAVAFRNLDLGPLSNLAFTVPFHFVAGVNAALPTGKLETQLGLGWESMVSNRDELSLSVSLFVPLGGKADEFTWRRVGASLTGRVDFDAPDRGAGFGGGIEGELGGPVVRLRLRWGLGYQATAGLSQSFGFAVVWNEHAP